MPGCGHRKVVTGIERVCARQEDHRPPHRDAYGISWVVGAELEQTGYADFDRFVDEHDVTSDEEGAAFGARLHEQSEWDDRIDRDDG